MPYDVKDAIRFAHNDSASNFQDSINDLLMDKLRNRIEVEKVAVAQKFFNQTEDEITDEAPEVEQEQEEITDEDV